LRGFKRGRLGSTYSIFLYLNNYFALLRGFYSHAPVFSKQKRGLLRKGTLPRVKNTRVKPTRHLCVHKFVTNPQHSAPAGAGKPSQKKIKQGAGLLRGHLREASEYWKSAAVRLRMSVHFGAGGTLPCG
jgi:hypothetical protein